MAPPQLSTYQKAATSIYEPQKAAEKNSLVATNKTTKNTLEAGKGEIANTYQQAIDNLASSVSDESAQISHLYTERLGGNFSGLQGNDMGKMFSKANQQQGYIETTRANKLAEITTGEANADIAMNTGIANLKPKYQSLETQYAQNAYGKAQSSYSDQQYKAAQLQLAQERVNISANNSANSANNRADAAAAKNASQFKVVGKADSNGIKSTSNGYNFLGPGGKPINLAEYVTGKGGSVNDVLDLLQNGSSYDQAIYRQVKAANTKNPKTILQVIAAEDRKNYYGFK